MKTGMLFCLAVVAWLSPSTLATDDSPFEGAWVTNTYGDVSEPQKTGLLAKIAASAVNGGGTGGALSNTQSRNTDQPEGFSGAKTAIPPIALEVKVDKGKVKITISEVVLTPSFKIKKLKLDEWTVTRKQFQFVTVEKSDTVVNIIRWVGELDSENVLKVTRQTKAGNPIDDGPLVFYRTK